MKRAISLNGFTPIPGPYETGALIPDRKGANALCKAINDLSSGWTIEELKVNGTSYWKVVWLGPKG